MNTPATPPTREQQKLKALEAVLEMYLGHKQRADALQGWARVIADLLASDMTEEQQNACWTLLRYVKEKESPLRQAQARMSDDKSGLIATTLNAE